MSSGTAAVQAVPQTTRPQRLGRSTPAIDFLSTGPASTPRPPGRRLKAQNSALQPPHKSRAALRRGIKYDDNFVAREVVIDDRLLGDGTEEIGLGVSGHGHPYNQLFLGQPSILVEFADNAR